MSNIQLTVDELNKMQPIDIITSEAVRSRFIQIHDTLWGAGTGLPAYERESIYFNGILRDNEKLHLSTLPSADCRLSRVSVRCAICKDVTIASDKTHQEENSMKVASYLPSAATESLYYVLVLGRYAMPTILFSYMRKTLSPSPTRMAASRCLTHATFLTHQITSSLHICALQGQTEQATTL